jgi:hypothetical protein
VVHERFALCGIRATNARIECLLVQLGLLLLVRDRGDGSQVNDVWLSTYATRDRQGSAQCNEPSSYCGSVDYGISITMLLAPSDAAGSTQRHDFGKQGVSKR